jgi:peptidyl-prolyl cis-trans isomerase C
MTAHEVHELLLARARALGIAGASDEQAIDALLDREVPVPAPTVEECRRWYDEHPAAVRGADLVEAAHILFAVTADAPLPALRALAQDVLAQALAAPQRFAALARAYSNCPSAQLGGNLGQFSRGDVAPEFWRAIEAFAGVGVLPALVETRFGLHVVRVDRRVPGASLPFERAQGRIAALLAERALRRALRGYARALQRQTDLH